MLKSIGRVVGTIAYTVIVWSAVVVLTPKAIELMNKGMVKAENEYNKRTNKA